MLSLRWWIKKRRKKITFYIGDPRIKLFTLFIFRANIVRLKTTRPLWTWTIWRYTDFSLIPVWEIHHVLYTNHGKKKLVHISHKWINSATSVSYCYHLEKTCVHFFFSKKKPRKAKQNKVFLKCTVRR